MARRLVVAFVAMAMVVMLCAASSAWGKPRATVQDFRFSAQRAEGGVVVRVQFDHALLGWVDAGQVTFKDSGIVVLTIRGEQPRVVTNLAQALSAVIARRGADAFLGRQLAQLIERHKAMP
ncbi:hypothetical protein [Megalodesulfovibrio gigas]|nr:hypothetical protein [Megalodesulfovibrio gigas]